MLLTENLYKKTQNGQVDIQVDVKSPNNRHPCMENLG